ncbi:MAG: hypothetical protein V4710_20945 [Verrucomicrobiota bacterium]
MSQQNVRQSRRLFDDSGKKVFDPLNLPLFPKITGPGWNKICVLLCAIHPSALQGSLSPVESRIARKMTASPLSPMADISKPLWISHLG